MPRLYVNSRGRAGVSFGAIGCAVYVLGVIFVAALVVLAWLLKTAVEGVVWVCRWAWRQYRAARTALR